MKRKPPSHYDHGESSWDAKTQSFDDWLRADLHPPIAREVLSANQRAERESKTLEPEWT